MFIKFIEIYKTNFTSSEQKYGIRETFVNSNHIVRFAPALDFKELLINEKLPLEGLDKNHEFTVLIVNNGYSTSSVIVINSMDDVEKKINRGMKQILRG